MAPTFDIVGITVADMGKALDFYRRLGLDIPPEADAEGHVEATLPGGLRLAWDAIDVIRSFTPEWTSPSGSPRMSLGFRCDSPAEVDRVFAELTGAGYAAAHEPWDAFWGQRYAVVSDPDGNHVDLFAPTDAPTSTG